MRVHEYMRHKIAVDEARNIDELKEAIKDILTTIYESEEEKRDARWNVNKGSI